MADVLPAKALVAAYTAFTLWFPLLSFDVLKVAVPTLLSVPVPIVVLPSMKLTVPLGVTPVDEVTVAVKVTSCPTLDGFGAEPSTAVVMALFTVWVKVADVLLANRASPPYTATIFSEPAGRLDVLKVACPELSVPVPSTVVPCLKVTVPVGAPGPEGVTVAVNVTDCPK